MEGGGRGPEERGDVQTRNPNPNHLTLLPNNPILSDRARGDPTFKRVTLTLTLTLTT